MALQFNTQTATGNAAAQIINQLNTVFGQIETILTKGVPARGDTPAISADDLKNALGQDNLLKIENAKAALN